MPTAILWDSQKLTQGSLSLYFKAPSLVQIQLPSKYMVNGIQKNTYISWIQLWRFTQRY